MPWLVVLSLRKRKGLHTAACKSAHSHCRQKINNSEAKESSSFTIISGKVLPIYHAFAVGVLDGKDTIDCLSR